MTKRLKEGNIKEDVKEPVMDQIEKGHEEFEEAKKHKAAVEEDYKMDDVTVKVDKNMSKDPLEKINDIVNSHDDENKINELKQVIHSQISSSSILSNSMSNTRQHMESTDFIIESDNSPLTLPMRSSGTVSDGESKTSPPIKTSYDSLVHDYSEEPLKQLKMKKMANTKKQSMKTPTNRKYKSRKVVLFSDDALLRSNKKPMIKVSGLRASGLKLETKTKKKNQPFTNSQNRNAKRSSELFNSCNTEAIKHSNALTLKYVKKNRYNTKMNPNASVEVINRYKIPITIALHSDFVYTEKILKDAQAVCFGEIYF